MNKILSIVSIFIALGTLGLALFFYSDLKGYQSEVGSILESEPVQSTFNSEEKIHGEEINNFKENQEVSLVERVYLLENHTRSLENRMGALYYGLDKPGQNGWDQKDCVGLELVTPKEFEDSLSESDRSILFRELNEAVDFDGGVKLLWEGATGEVPVLSLSCKDDTKTYLLVSSFSGLTNAFWIASFETVADIVVSPKIDESMFHSLTKIEKKGKDVYLSQKEYEEPWCVVVTKGMPCSEVPEDMKEEAQEIPVHRYAFNLETGSVTLE